MKQQIRRAVVATQAAAKLLAASKPMVVGLPKTFWVVTRPTGVSTLGDIVFEADFARLMLQTRGGLLIDEVLGFFADEKKAKTEAERALQEQKGSVPAEPPSWLASALRVPYKLAVKQGFEVSLDKDNELALMVSFPDVKTKQQYLIKVEDFARVTPIGPTAVVLEAADV